MYRVIARSLSSLLVGCDAVNSSLPTLRSRREIPCTLNVPQHPIINRPFWRGVYGGGLVASPKSPSVCKHDSNPSNPKLRGLPTLGYDYVKAAAHNNYE